MISQSKKSICVYCAHRDGTRPEYLQAAVATGELIAKRGHRLVYGAGDIGLMGAVAQGAQDCGGDTFGVIPQHLMRGEVAKRDLSTLVVTENMHERKKIMVMNADAFVLLPGGLGSLDEFFELITWRQLGLHQKPCFIINTAGYWDHLIALINHQIAEGFVPEGNTQYFRVLETVSDLDFALADHFS
ncbi:cytokinin riboside 5'-monophosphate phosphoribohydrolase [Amylibacter marinus]|uniref:Cytokinin riboside 5'-monophosphate phosphoribohydrolase n=1 Tax=Amylibacter marinus TaxID=1475483 RepID=A0ABQ5VTH3_9RHOB|nr:TIGR00730 family Rossman fold protein [Amylibacter marinus]GLQ34730.1 cytokinin riboside 5'-monophosphate phosphoribohydrolase [Amylibacter marinus]